MKFKKIVDLHESNSSDLEDSDLFVLQTENGTSKLSYDEFKKSLPRASTTEDGLLSKSDYNELVDIKNKKHSHSNKSLLDTITSSLVSKWNDAFDHISDTSMHITSSERTSIGNISNKVDKVSGKGLSTNDYTTTEKSKLAGISSGAEVNQNAFSNVKVGSSILAADSKTDTFALTGSNVTLTPNTSTKALQIGITKNNVINALGYTPSSSGAVSTVDSSLSSTSTNPVQNKVIYNKFETICHISYYTATIDSWIALARIPVQWSGRFYLCFGIAEVIIDLSFHIDHRPALSVFVQREFMHTMLLYTRLVKNDDYSASLCIKPTSDFSGGSTCKIHVQSIGRQLSTNGYNFQLYTSETPITFTSSDVINYDGYYNYEYVND